MEIISVQQLIDQLRAYPEINDGEAARLMRCAADTLERAGTQLPGDPDTVIDLENAEVEL